MSRPGHCYYDLSICALWSPANLFTAPVQVSLSQRQTRQICLNLVQIRSEFLPDWVPSSLLQRSIEASACMHISGDWINVSPVTGSALTFALAVAFGH